MYKIRMTCSDWGETPYEDEVNKTFESRDEAIIELFKCVIDEECQLNAPCSGFEPRTNIFAICRNYKFNGKEYIAAVICWDKDTGIEGQFVTGYYIEECI